MNPNRKIKIEKITLNIGAGKDQGLLDKGVKLIKYVTGIEPMKTKTTKRIPAWGLRPGLPIGCKLTLRGKNMRDFVVRFLKAKNNILKLNNFDADGNIAFGVEEYIDVPGVKYNPELGLMGFQVCFTVSRNGYRVKNRKIKKKSISLKHKVTKEESVEFIKSEFGIKVEDN
ncbi:MAG: 50S ribosomal protein L5 [Candidatus Woesearchaeota archaeon]